MPDVVLGAGEAMRRREFIALSGSAAVAWPLAARAQPPAKPLIGFLNSASSSSYAPMVAAFQDGLNQTGFVDGRNVAIEYHWAEGDYDLLPWFAATLVNHKVAAIISGGGPAALAAKSAATTGRRRRTTRRMGRCRRLRGTMRAKPAVAERVKELWAIAGRRSGKSRMAAAVLVYIDLLPPQVHKLGRAETCVQCIRRYASPQTQE